MAIKKFKPITPSLRYMQLSDFSEITKKKPERSLTVALRKSGGRNQTGRITCRHRGGGAKRRYRIIDFNRKTEGEAKVLGIEYDPNRSANIALIQYKDNSKKYIIAPKGLKVGEVVQSGENVPPKIGNALPLNKIPLGTAIHNVEITPGSGAKIARSAGQQVILSNREAKYALVKMPSGEIRKIHINCYATIGQVGNTQHMNIVSGKAGRTRNLGRRPKVRGVCKNPVDHPNGGGEGKSKSGGGRQHLKSPWGHVKGQKTRRKHKQSEKFIIERKKKKTRK